MLTYEENPTTIDLDGRAYTMFADDQDPARWYCVPVTPAVSQRGEALEFRLVKYRGASKDQAGGWLTLSVDLELDEALCQRLSERLVAMKGLTHAVTISAPIWVGGSAQLVVPGAPGELFPVSLTPDARAVLTWGEMTPEQVAFMEGLLSHAGASNSPVYVAYALEFVAVRRAFSMTLKANWEQVRSYVATTFEVGAVVAQLQIDHAVDTMCSDGAIELKVVDEDPDPNARRFAIQELTQMLLATFFEPAPLIKPQPGQAPVMGWRVVRVSIDETNSRTLEFDLSSRQHLIRRAYPQGALANLPASAQALAPYIDAIDIDSTFFDNRQVRTYCAARLDARSRINQITAEFCYGSGGERARKSLLFGPEHADDLELVSWPMLASGARAVEIKTSIDFAPSARQDTWPKQSHIESITSSHYVLDPTRIYRVVDVSISALGEFDWGVFSRVEIAFEHPLYMARPYTITRGAPTASASLMWPVSLESIAYTLTYSSSSGEDEVKGELTAGAPAIFYDLATLTPHVKTLRVIPAVDWSNDSAPIREVDLDIAYRRAHVSLTFTPSDSSPRDFRVVESARTSDSFEYEGVVIHEDLTKTKIGPASTSDAVLRLRLP